MPKKTKYKTYRIIDGKPRWIIVDETGNIVNRNPSKDELKGLEKEIRYDQDTRKYRKYTEEDLLSYLKQFFEENGKVPTTEDFKNNPEYPSFGTYTDHFGSWSNALKQVGFDTESIVKRGILETRNQKARFAEMIVRDHFKKNPIDLSGKNCISPCDGICPNGKIYDVKSSKLYNDMYWNLNTHNIYKEEIEIYYFLAFNIDYTELKYTWRIPGEMVEKDYFIIGLSSGYEFNIENMKEYDITDKIKRIT